MTHHTSKDNDLQLYVSAVPPTRAEAAAADKRWTKRGMLRRLVWLDTPRRL